jgi:hypothetical protein
VVDNAGGVGLVLESSTRMMCFFFFFFLNLESAFVTRCMYVVTKTHAGDKTARLVGMVK